MDQRKQKRTAAAALEHPKLNHELLGASISLQAGGDATSQATKPTATRTAAIAKQTIEEPTAADIGLRATVKPKRRSTRTTAVANQTKASQKPVADVGLKAAVGNEASQTTKPKKRPIPTTTVAKQIESNQGLPVSDAGWVEALRTEIRWFDYFDDGRAGISAEHQALHKRLHSAFERVGETLFFGYVVDPRELHKRFVVEIMLDGVPTKLLHAEQYDPKLRNGGFGDGCYAFEFVAKPDWLDRHHVVEARIANTSDRLGEAILLSASISHDRAQAPIGAVSWVGGVRLSGWVRDDQNREPGVRAFEGDVLLAETQPDRWAHIESEHQLLAARVGFELWLPETLADGRVHRIRVTDHNDLELAGSPVSILAFRDGIQSILAKSEFDARDTRRLEFLAELLPMSLPFVNYAEWQARFPPPVAPSDSRSSIAVVLVGTGDSEKTLASLEGQTTPQWTASVLPQGKTAGDVFDPADLINFLNGDASKCSAVAFAFSGTIFRAECLARFTDVFASNPNALIAYSDIALVGQDGRSWPAFFPAFDYERLLEQGYAASCFALRRDTALSVMSKQPTTLFRLFNSVLDGGSSKVFDRVTHLPGVSAAVPEASLLRSHDALAQATKAHLEARGIQADIHSSSSALFPAVRVRRRIADHPSVAIIVPTRDRVDLLRNCIDSVQQSAPEVVKEIIIVDNDSSDAETRTYLRRAAARGVKVLEVPGPFNYSRLNNRAVATTSAEYVCLLNNDAQVIEPNWLLELLSRIADPSVGAAGTMLIWPNDVVQHGGVTLGPYFGAVHAFNDRIREDPGYCDLLHVARECSAVTAACMLLRRSDYLAVNGMDEVLFPVNFNDVDLCLKLRARGYRIVFTPHTALLHYESATRGADRRAFDRERAARELVGLRARWGETVANDPFYNPQLNLDGTPYSGLAWPPRSYEARTRFSAAPREIPAGF